MPGGPWDGPSHANTTTVKKATQMANQQAQNTNVGSLYIELDPRSGGIVVKSRFIDGRGKANDIGFATVHTSLTATRTAQAFVADLVAWIDNAREDQAKAKR